MDSEKSVSNTQISTVLQELDGFTYATALDRTWAITPSDWTLIHPKYVPLFFRGDSTPTFDDQWASHFLQTHSKLRCQS